MIADEAIGWTINTTISFDATICRVAVLKRGTLCVRKKITCRHLVWVFAVVAVIVDIVVELFSIACVTEAQTGGEGRGGEGRGRKARKGKGRDLESRLRQLNHVTKFSVNFSVTAHYIYSKIRSFMQCSPIRVTVQIFFRTNCLLQVCSLP